MALFIRPVYTSKNSVIPSSVALCSTNGQILVDSQILEHFSPTTSGIEIKKTAKEFYAREGEDIEWGNPINNP